MKKRSEHKFLTKQQVLGLLECPRKAGKARDYYLLAMTFFLALRIGETVKMRGTLLRLDGRHPHALVPTEKRRGPGRHDVCRYTGRPLIPVPVLDGLRVMDGARKWGSRRRWLFEGNRPGRPMSSRNATKIFKAWASEAGLDERVSTHSLRHTAGSLLWQSQQDMALCRDFLRHASIKTTSEYIHTMPERWSKAKGGLLG